MAVVMSDSNLSTGVRRHSIEEYIKIQHNGSNVVIVISNKVINVVNDVMNYGFLTTETNS